MTLADVLKLEIAEVEENSLCPEYSDLDVKHILRIATREGRNIFKVFSVREKEKHLVASKWRRDDSQKQRRSQRERWTERKAKALRWRTGESGLPLVKTWRRTC